MDPRTKIKNPNRISLLQAKLQRQLFQQKMEYRTFPLYNSEWGNNMVNLITFMNL